MDTCRLCSTSRSLKDLSKIDNKKLEIQKKLLETFNIELTSSHSSSNNFCCRICIKKLNNSHSFYLQIVENQKKFEDANFEFSSVVVKVEKIDDKSLNFCGDIKVEKEENIEDDFGDSFGAGTFDDDESNDFREDNDDDEDEFEYMEADEDVNKKSLKLSAAGRMIQNDLNYLYYEYESSQVNAALCEMGFECLNKLFEGQPSSDFIKNIKFTAKEIDDCTIVEDGHIKFLQKRHFNTQGKTPYLRYLCDKLREASATKSIFKVSEGFKASGKKNKACYVFCDHRRKMPVSFVAFDHQFGSPLTMRWKVDCAFCSGHQKREKKEVKENVEPRTVISYEPASTENVEFKRAMKILAGSLNTVLLGIEHKCLSGPNPMQVLYNNIAEFGIIANSAIVDTIFALQRTMT